jgi:hypothetical protein
MDSKSVGRLVTIHLCPHHAARLTSQIIIPPRKTGYARFRPRGQYYIVLTSILFHE